MLMCIVCVLQFDIDVLFVGFVGLVCYEKILVILLFELCLVVVVLMNLWGVVCDEMIGCVWLMLNVLVELLMLCIFEIMCVFYYFVNCVLVLCECVLGIYVEFDMYEVVVWVFKDGLVDVCQCLLVDFVVLQVQGECGFELFSWCDVCQVVWDWLVCGG